MCHAMLIANNIVLNEPRAVFLTDDIIRSQTPVIKQMMEVYAQQQVSVLALQRVEPEQVSRYGVVKVAQSDGRIQEVVDMVEKPDPTTSWIRSEEHTSELQSLTNLVCRLLLEKKKKKKKKQKVKIKS